MANMTEIWKEFIPAYHYMKEDTRNVPTAGAWVSPKLAIQSCTILKIVGLASPFSTTGNIDDPSISPYYIVSCYRGNSNWWILYDPRKEKWAHLNKDEKELFSVYRLREEAGRSPKALSKLDNLTIQEAIAKYLDEI